MTTCSLILMLIVLIVLYALWLSTQRTPTPLKPHVVRATPVPQTRRRRPRQAARAASPPHSRSRSRTAGPSRRSPATATHPRPTGRRRDQDPPCATLVVYHGTSADGAAAILRAGFWVGDGNALGDGVYFSTRWDTARQYAGASGLIIKCVLRPGRCCRMNPSLQQQFHTWSAAHTTPADSSALTAFLLHRGYQTLRQGDVFVRLRPRTVNRLASTRKDPHIRILSVHRVKDGQRVRV